MILLFGRFVATGSTAEPPAPLPSSPWPGPTTVTLRVDLGSPRASVSSFTLELAVPHNLKSQVNIKSHIGKQTRFHTIASLAIDIRKFITTWIPTSDEMTRRRKGQLVAQILATCQGAGSSKTEIACASGLNFNTVNAYLDLLTPHSALKVK